MRALNVLLALATLATLIALVLGRRRQARSAAWLLLRSLFPSWRFFETIAPAPALSYRLASGDGDFGAWREALRPVPRTATSLLWNPRGNLRLAQQSLVERLLDELDSLPKAEVMHSVSYRLVQRLVLAEAGPSQRQAERYQFRIRVQGGGDDEPDFVSDVHQR